MSGIRKTQFGKETTAGTAAAATMVWRSEAAQAVDEVPVEFIAEDTGYLVPTDRTIKPRKLAGIKFPDAPANFEQLPYVFCAGIKSVITGAADGTGTGKIYDYPVGATAANTLKTFTIETGDADSPEEMEHGFVDSFKLSWTEGQPVKVGHSWKGRQLTTGTFTAALAPTAVEDMLTGATKLYIDPTTIATTQKTATLIGAELNCKTGWVPRYYNENLFFTTVVFNKDAFECTLDATFEFNAVSIAEVVAYKAQTLRLIRLLTEGSTYAQAGTVYSKATLIVDLCGKWSQWKELGVKDGNSVFSAKFTCAYNVTAALIARFCVVVAQASLT
jgi:hypothetical protein